MDKNKAIINYLLDCPSIKDNPLYFNFGEEEDSNTHIITNSMDKALERPYINGSVLKLYTFTIIDYHAIVHDPLVFIPSMGISPPGYENENMVDMMDVQAIIDWVEEQNDKYIFPNFGDDCVIQSIQALSSAPNLSGIDTRATQSLAKYSVAIRITYIDNSKAIWK